MTFTCNINHKGDYDLKYLDIGFYQEESTHMNPVITVNEVSDGMNFNNVKSGIITADHDIGEIKLNAYQNDVDLSHHENEGERNNFSFDEKEEENLTNKSQLGKNTTPCPNKATKQLFLNLNSTCMILT
jgi:hypothetical protein